MHFPVVDVYTLVGSRYQVLKFVEVEETQELEINDIGHAITEVHDLFVDLPIELEIGQQMNVLDAVVIGYQDVLSTRLQFHHFCLAKLAHVQSEVELQSRHVRLVFKRQQITERKFQDFQSIPREKVLNLGQGAYWYI